MLLSDFVFSLAPGASAFLTQTAFVSATTINTATWAAYNPGPVDVAESTAEAQVVFVTRYYLPLIMRQD
jgi:hypothetical protein